MTHITIERAKLEQVLKALGDPVLLNGVNNAKFFIKAALAQPVQLYRGVRLVLTP